MDGWQVNGAKSTHSNSHSVPVGRAAGVMLDGQGWSATCLPVRVGSRTFLVAPSHVLDEVGTCGLVELSNHLVVDTGPVAVPPAEWVHHEQYDLAAALLPEKVRSWPTFWSAEWLTVDPADDSIATAPLHTGWIASIRRPIRERPSSVSNDEVRNLEVGSLGSPGEYFLAHPVSTASSGSPLFADVQGDVALCGLVTGQIQVESANVGISVLRATLIVEFLNTL